MSGKLVYMQKWPAGTVLCHVCEQPDNTGDCDHTPLTEAQIIELGGSLEPYRPLASMEACWNLVGDLHVNFPHKGIAHIEVYSNGAGRPRFISTELLMTEAEINQIIMLGNGHGFHVSVQAEDSNVVFYFDGDS